jgi:hypothetical protein
MILGFDNIAKRKGIELNSVPLLLKKCSLSSIF